MVTFGSDGARQYLPASLPSGAQHEASAMASSFKTFVRQVLASLETLGKSQPAWSKCSCIGDAPQPGCKECWCVVGKQCDAVHRLWLQQRCWWCWRAASRYHWLARMPWPVLQASWALQVSPLAPSVYLHLEQSGPVHTPGLQAGQFPYSIVDTTAPCDCLQATSPSATTPDRPDPMCH